MNLSLCNYAVTGSEQVIVDFEEVKNVKSARYIVGDKMSAHNDFDHPEVIVIKEFSDFTLEDNTLKVTVPAMSVITLQFEV